MKKTVWLECSGNIRMRGMFNELALMMLMMWPAIPMVLIQLHLVPSF
jgi:hypothetical protein